MRGLSGLFGMKEQRARLVQGLKRGTKGQDEMQETNARAQRVMQAEGSASKQRAVQAIRGQCKQAEGSASK
jgi:hypothetical protein